MEVNIGWPEGIWIAMTLLGLLIAQHKDGQTKTYEYSFNQTVMNAIISGGMLYWGGFFS